MKVIDLTHTIREDMPGLSGDGNAGAFTGQQL